MDDRAIINNSNSTSRFRFKGAAKVSEDFSAGFLMEFGVGGLSNTGGLETRHQALYVKSKQLGTIWLGKTSEATDGIMEISLATSDPSTLGSLSPFDSFLADQTGFAFNMPFDGGRKNVIRYITPIIGGFVASASWSDAGDNAWDASLRYAGEFGQIRVAAGVGYRRENASALIDLETGDAASGKREFWGGSASVMHTPSGLFLDGQYGESDGLQTADLNLSKLVGIFDPGAGAAIGVLNLNDVSVGIDAKARVMGGRVGIAKKAFAIGKTTAYVEYNKFELSGLGPDVAAIKPTMYGFGLAQDIDQAAMTIYFSYRHIDFDLGIRDGDDNLIDDDADVFIVGSKIRF
jgi:predicted porin